MFKVKYEKRLPSWIGQPPVGDLSEYKTEIWLCTRLSWMDKGSRVRTYKKRKLVFAGNGEHFYYFGESDFDTSFRNPAPSPNFLIVRVNKSVEVLKSSEGDYVLVEDEEQRSRIIGLFQVWETSVTSPRKNGPQPRAQADAGTSGQRGLP